MTLEEAKVKYAELDRQEGATTKVLWDIWCAKGKLFWDFQMSVLATAKAFGVSPKTVRSYSRIYRLMEDKQTILDMGIEVPNLEEVTSLRNATLLTTHINKEIKRKEVGIPSRKFESKKVEVTDYVYLISDGTYTKIGITNNLTKRLKVLQTGNPHKLTYIDYVPCDDASRVEKELHNLYALKHMVGEWFNLNEVDVKNILDDITAQQR